MPPRSKIETELPDQVLSELNSRLINSGFSGYLELEKWLKQQGFSIGKSSIGRYGMAFEKRLSQVKLSTEMAKTLIDNVADDGDALGEALTRVAQDKAFNLLIDLDIDADNITPAQLFKAVTDLGRISAPQKKFAQEVRSQMMAKMSASAKANGVSEETIAKIRSEVLGMAS